MSKRITHIRQLARKLHAEVFLHETESSYGLPDGEATEFGDVYVWGWDGSKLAYLVALHELGHIACGHPFALDTDYFPRELDAEVEAWEWAFKTSREHVGAGLIRTIVDTPGWGFSTYVENGSTRFEPRTAAFCTRHGIVRSPQ